jgi:hypothetical protein
MIKYQTKRIIGNPTETVMASFPTLPTMERVIGIFCRNENTQDFGEAQIGLDVGGIEIFSDDFPLRLITSNSKKTPNFRHVETRLKRYFDLTPFAACAGGETVDIWLTGNKNFAVNVVLVLDDVPVSGVQSRKYQIVRLPKQPNQTTKKIFTTASDYSKVTGISLISDQLTGGFCYTTYSRFGLKIGGSEIFPTDYPANNLLVNPQCVQFDGNFYDLKSFDVQANGTTAEMTYLHNAPNSTDLICVFELEK